MGLGRDSLPRWLGYLESTSQPRWILEVKKKLTDELLAVIRISQERLKEERDMLFYLGRRK